MVIVFANTITPRLRYITEFIGKEISGKAFLLTDNRIVYGEYRGPRINYSNERIASEEYWLQPHLLLFENDIHPQAVECFEVNGDKAFFKTGGDLPFDIFAACFYLLSRYEEWLPHKKDRYGRYAHEHSLAYRENFLHVPLINRWLLAFRKELRGKFPLLAVAYGLSTEEVFRFLPTYDIDEAWSFKHKAWWRSGGAAVKDLCKGRFSRFKLRRAVLNGKAQDPFDAYDWIDDLHRPHSFKPRYFFLVAARTGRFDRNILPSETALQSLVRRHAVKYDIGVHPSWQSGDDPSLLKKEIEMIEGIARIKVNSSRQHFIRFTLPETYRRLIDAGIREDFSMGYGSANGFRASVASPFYWYDLEKEEQTNLLLYPFCFMEANSFFEQGMNATEALDELRRFYQAVRSVNGLLITIWHNTFLGTDDLFKGWREAYRQFVEEIGN